MSTVKVQGGGLLVLGGHCEKLEFQRCTLDVYTGAEKGSVMVWEYKGKWGGGPGNVRNGPELWWE
jgi:hypothetical protein